MFQEMTPKSRQRKYWLRGGVAAIGILVLTASISAVFILKCIQVWGDSNPLAGSCAERGVSYYFGYSLGILFSPPLAALVFLVGILIGWVYERFA